MEEALKATKESQRLDFKRQFDPSSQGEWCELIKDIVAIANSGGGIILIGLCDDGSSSELKPTGGQKLDPAMVDDKIFKYTSQHLSGLQLVQAQKGTQEILAILIPSVDFPIIFTSPGTYPVGDGRQQTAFGRGTLYYRHGAKSDVAAPEDVRSIFDNLLMTRREEWLGNIRRVVEAPAGSVVHVIPSQYKTNEDSASKVGVRLVHDPNAIEVPRWNPDETHPYRLKELVSSLNKLLPKSITGFDVQCVRDVYDIDLNPNYFYRSMHGSPQYSVAFQEWMIEEFNKDNNFFSKARGSRKRYR